MGLAGAGPGLVALRAGAVDVAPQRPRARPRLALLADEVEASRPITWAVLR